MRKSIIAFANTQGGCLVIGVDDVAHKVVGVDDDSAFQIMDRIANAVADSCAPQIVPNIELQTIDGHTVVLVTVTPEPNRPYYLKAKGKELGTYIRLAGTSRPASPEKIKELEMEGAHISWDELTCIGYEVTDKEIMRMIGMLPTGYRTVFNLYVLEQKSHKEIAAMLDIGESTSASQYLRARKMLARMVKDYENKH